MSTLPSATRPVVASRRVAPSRVQRPQLLTEVVLAAIRQSIVDGSLTLGEQVSEAQLAQQMGVSKTPVREALARLSRDGLVHIHPQRGTFVFAMSSHEVLEICRFREFVEVAALELAIKHDRDALVAQLSAGVERMARAHKARDWRAMPMLDQAFHQVIVDHCGNDYFKHAYRSIGSKFSALRARLPAENERVSHCQDSHAALVALVRKGRTSVACAALAAHIRDTLGSYQAACADPATPQPAIASVTARRRAKTTAQTRS